MAEPNQLTNPLTSRDEQLIYECLGDGGIFSDYDTRYMTALALREIVSLREAVNNLEYMISQLPGE